MNEEFTQSEVSKLRILPKITNHLGQIIVLLFVGVSIGLYVGYKIYIHKMDEVTKMGRMLYQDKVYDIMLSEKLIK